MLIKLTMLLVFFSVMVAIGLYCRKSASDVNGFVLGGRSVGPWLTAFAYGTSYFSAVVFVGYAGQFGWKYGIAATWAGIGNALLGSLLAWVVLGRRTRIMSQHLDSATMPEFFGKRFGSPSLKVAASVIIFIFLIPYTASLYNGLSRLFGMAFDIDYTVCVIVMAVLTGVYVIAGGYMATAINDFIQGIIMLFGICAVILAVLNSQGGFLAALEGLSQVSDPAVSSAPGVFASFFGPDPANLLGVVLLTSLGTWGLPQMVQKFYAIKSEKSIDAGTVISTLFALVVAGGCYFLGGFGRLFAGQMEVVNGVPVGGYDVVIPTMLSGLPDLLMAVVAVRLHVHPVLPGAHLQLHPHPGSDPGPSGQGHEPEEAGLCDAVSHRGVHRHLGGAGHHPVQVQRHLHRPAHGGVLGRAGRSLPGPLPVRPVLEKGHQGSLLDQLSVLHPGDDGQHFLPVQLPRPAPLPHQRRGLLYAGRSGPGSGGLTVHPPSGRHPGRGRLLLL